MVRALIVALALAAVAACAPAVKDIKPALGAEDSGTVWFSPDGTLVLSGDLRLPSRSGPVPAVILAHGCGGVGNAETGWVDPLRSAGYATFVIDSFSGRGLREVCTTAELTPGRRIPDAYAALGILATHPRVDAKRIALMGFSHGGLLTLQAATTWARDRYAAAGTSFRAFLPFYPSCNFRFPELRRLAAPVRIHTGELDDWTPAGPCQELTRSLEAQGVDIDIVVYAGAHHSFDNIGRPVQVRPDVINGSACRFEMPSIVGPGPSQAELASCRRKGATIGWNPGATEQARKNVRAQLAELLR